ncbi:tyrosine-protein phosphatase [Candidatus Frankia nodulisporulans]|uniref:tyrosine-protein phosphatase n=1 Tax=Candidatus Frankia nodulisporulans TaxID=2060052 RepID=UPI0013D8074F|nr:tyrosine-protein phosphatase [Candidatus Frankia nodulisporulans]
MTAAQYVPGWVDLVGAHNVRDLGGLPAAGGTVRRRVLLRGDNLDALTAEDIAVLGEDVALRGVVDLRAPFESPRAAEWFPRLGITWLHEPLADLTALSNADALADQVRGDYSAMYALMLDNAGPGLARILAFLVDGGHTPTLLHCAAGKDRTGITVAVLLSVAGVERSAIIADYLATGERLDRVRAALARNPAYQHLMRRAAASGTDSGADSPPRTPFKIDPRAIHGVLDVVEAAEGGVAGFLRSHGATAEQISGWQQLIIEPY